MKDLVNFINEALKINKDTKLANEVDDLVKDAIFTIGQIVDEDIKSKTAFIKMLHEVGGMSKTEANKKYEQLEKLMTRHVNSENYTSFVVHASPKSKKYFTPTGHTPIKLNGHEIYFDGPVLPEQLHWVCIPIFCIGFLNDGTVDIVSEFRSRSMEFDVTLEFVKSEIKEALKISKDTKVSNYYKPKNRNELIELIDKLIEKRGNEADLNDIDTSEITDMSYLFYDAWDFNGDISEWDVSNVKDMSSMFKDAPFDGDISNWDVSNVEHMNCMFMDSFFSGKNGDISKWDVSKVKNMNRMFYGCPLESNPPKWYKS